MEESATECCYGQLLVSLDYKLPVHQKLGNTVESLLRGHQLPNNQSCVGAFGLGAGGQGLQVRNIPEIIGR